MSVFITDITDITDALINYQCINKPFPFNQTMLVSFYQRQGNEKQAVCTLRSQCLRRPGGVDDRKADKKLVNL